jgi:hypothetical protein
MHMFCFKQMIQCGGGGGVASREELATNGSAGSVPWTRTTMRLVKLSASAVFRCQSSHLVHDGSSTKAWDWR